MNTTHKVLIGFTLGLIVVGILGFLFASRPQTVVTPGPTAVVVVEPNSALPVIIEEQPSSTIEGTEQLVAPTSTEVIPPISTTTRILFVGDLMLDRNVATRTRKSGSLTYPFQRLPEHWIQSFDYAVANLEGSLTDKRRPPEKSIDFQFDPAFLPILQAQGFDAFSQANNHALDQGAPGYEDSVKRLREAGFLVFGHQVRDDEVAVATTTINGRSVAFVGFNTTDNPLDRESAARAIQSARAGADLVIADMHWGAEYQDHPIPQAVELSHWLIDQGVDIVIGGHPHWVQGIYTYKNHPIVYSLGNFVFDQDWSPETKQGMAIVLEFPPNHADKLTIRPIPLQIDLSQPRVLEGDAYTKRMDQLSKISGEDVKDQIKEGAVLFAW